MTANADPVLALAKVIADKEHEEECASRSDGRSSWRLDAELSQLDTQLERATPTSLEGAAFKLRKSAYFADDDPVADPILRLIEVSVENP